MSSEDVESEAETVRSLAPPRSSRRPLRLIAGLVFSAGTLALLGRGQSWSDVLRELRGVHWAPLTVAALLGVVGMLLQGLRTQMMMRGRARLPFHSQVLAHYVAFVGNVVLPFRVGELLRLNFLVRQSGLASSQVLATMALERVLDMTFMLLCLGLTGVASTGLVAASWGIVALASTVGAMLLSFVLMSRFPKAPLRWARALVVRLGTRTEATVMPRVEAFVASFSNLTDTGTVVRLCLTTIARWSLGLMAIQLWLWALDIHTVWFAPLLVLSFLSFGTLIPSSVAFVGTYHYAAVSALTLLGVDRTQAMTVAVVGHAVSFIPPSLIGGAWLGLAIWMGARASMADATRKPA
jgi:uncharacterized protein (TIRG00374 family)